MRYYSLVLQFLWPDPYLLLLPWYPCSSKSIYGPSCSCIIPEIIWESPFLFWEAALWNLYHIFISLPSLSFMYFLLRKEKNGRDSLRTKWPFRSLDFLGDYQYNPIKRLLQKFENHSVGKVFIWKTTSEASYVYFQDRNTVFEFSRNIQIFRRLVFLLSIWDIFGGKIQTILRHFCHNLNSSEMMHYLKINLTNEGIWAVVCAKQWKWCLPILALWTWQT